MLLFIVVMIVCFKPLIISLHLVFCNLILLNLTVAPFSCIPYKVSCGNKNQTHKQNSCFSDSFGRSASNQGSILCVSFVHIVLFPCSIILNYGGILQFSLSNHYLLCSHTSIIYLLICLAFSQSTEIFVLTIYFFLISKSSIFSFITKFIALYKYNILLPLPKLFTMFILNFLLFVLLSLFLLLSVLFLGCLSYKGCCFQIFAMLSVGFIFRMYFCYDLPWGFSLSRDKLGFCLLLITSI